MAGTKMYQKSEARQIKKEFNSKQYTLDEIAKMHNLGRGTVINIVTDYKYIKAYLKSKKKKPKGG